jgi:hypothetical protein
MNMIANLEILHFVFRPYPNLYRQMRFVALEPSHLGQATYALWFRSLVAGKPIHTHRGIVEHRGAFRSREALCQFLKLIPNHGI